MWVHVVIFVMILCALTGWKKGWIPSSGIGGKDGIRLFAVVAIAGNLLGMILTLQNGGQVYPQGYRLEKEDTGSYEKEFMVSVDGEEPVSMYIQVPEKELEEQEEEPKQNKKLTRKEQAQKSIAMRWKAEFLKVKHTEDLEKDVVRQSIKHLPRFLSRISRRAADRWPICLKENQLKHGKNEREKHVFLERLQPQNFWCR